MNARSQQIRIGKEFETHYSAAELATALLADFLTEAEAPNRIHG